MKILLVNLWRINNARGGTEKVFFNMASSLSSLDHEVICLTSDEGDGTPTFHEAGAKYQLFNCLNAKQSTYTLKLLNRLHTLCIVDKQKRKQLRYRLKTSLRYSALISEFKHHQADVIISFQPQATYLLTEIIKTEIPVVTMLHFEPGIFFSNLEHNILANEYAKACSKSAAVQCLMPNFVPQVKKALGENVNVVYIPNIVIPKNLKAQLNEKLIIYVGRMDSINKRPHLLVEAFNLLKDKYPDWKVEFWGETHIDPGYSNWIQKMIDDFALTNRVKLCGPTSNIDEKLLHSSIFACPSKSEGFGLALTEAMAVGIPAIGFRSAPGVNEMIINNRNGILVEDGIKSFAQGLDQLMADQDLRIQLGQNAIYDMQAFCPEKVWTMWNDLLYTIKK